MGLQEIDKYLIMNALEWYTSLRENELSGLGLAKKVSREHKAQDSIENIATTLNSDLAESIMHKLSDNLVQSEGCELRDIRLQFRHEHEDCKDAGYLGILSKYFNDDSKVSVFIYAAEYYEVKLMYIQVNCAERISDYWNKRNVTDVLKAKGKPYMFDFYQKIPEDTAKKLLIVTDIDGRPNTVGDLGKEYGNSMADFTTKKFVIENVEEFKEQAQDAIDVFKKYCDLRNAEISKNAFIKAKFEVS